MKVLSSLLFVTAFVAALDPAAPAYAYLDPGTGSMMLQVLLGGLVGAMTVVKLYWYRIKKWLPSGGAGPEDEGEATENER